MQLRLPLFDMRHFDAGQKIAQKTFANKQIFTLNLHFVTNIAALIWNCQWQPKLNALEVKLMVPGGGIEPPRCRQRGILSPVRLPIPPSRLRYNYNEDAHYNKQKVLCEHKISIFIYPTHLSHSILQANVAQAGSYM
jgi:hypothetical protein